MAVTVQDVLSPKGRLVAAVLWPGETPAQVDTKLRAFLADGEIQSEDLDEDEQDAATTAWVYHRAYYEVWQRLVAMPGTVADSDEGSSAYFVTQIQLMKDESDHWLNEFESFTPEDEAEEEYGIIQSLR